MVDFFRTLADLCELKAPGTVTGLSLAPALVQPSEAIRSSALTQYSSGYSLRTARYRYTEWGRDGAGGAELYDRDRDPEELVNLADRKDMTATREELSVLLRDRVSTARQKPKGLTQIEFKNRRRVR